MEKVTVIIGALLGRVLQGFILGFSGYIGVYLAAEVLV